MPDPYFSVQKYDNTAREVRSALIRQHFKPDLSSHLESYFRKKNLNQLPIHCIAHHGLIEIDNLSIRIDAHQRRGRKGRRPEGQTTQQSVCCVLCFSHDSVQLVFKLTKFNKITTEAEGGSTTTFLKTGRLKPNSTN